MNTPHNLTKRPKLSPSFGGTPAPRPNPARAATLSKSELQQIVAAMLG